MLLSVPTMIYNIPQHIFENKDIDTVAPDILKSVF